MNDTVKNAVTWLVGAAGLAILAMAIQFWISLNVDTQLEKAGLVLPADIQTLTSRADALDTRVDKLEEIHDKDVTRVEDKAERIAQILMEE